MNLKPEVHKHISPDCPFASNNVFYQKAFISACGLVNSFRKKALIFNTFTASQTAHELALNRLETILVSPGDHPEDADIESDDESSVASPPDFHSGNNPFRKSSSQDLIPLLWKL